MVNAELGCEYWRDAMRRFELTQVGVSEERYAFLYRCPVCRTYWIETERSTGAAIRRRRRTRSTGSDRA